MGAGRLRRRQVRTSEVQTGVAKIEQTSKAPRGKMTNDGETSQLESAHSLLLSSLRYWEVERDLIEERIATLRSLIVPS